MATFLSGNYSEDWRSALSTYIDFEDGFESLAHSRLHLAVLQMSCETLGEALSDQDALRQIDKPCHIIHGLSLTVLQLSALRRDLSSTCKLLDYGAEKITDCGAEGLISYLNFWLFPGEFTDKDWKSLELLIQRRGTLNLPATDSGADFILGLIVRRAPIRIFQQIIDAGLDFAFVYRGGWRMFHFLIYRGTRCAEIVKYLTDQGLDPNITTADGQDSTLIHLICWHSFPASIAWTRTVKSLVNMGADPFLKNSDGDFPLKLALDRGSSEFESYLTDYMFGCLQNVDAQLASAWGWELFELLIRYRRMSLLGRIIQNFGQFSFEKNGCTLLHLLAHFKDEQALSLFSPQMLAGIDPDQIGLESSRWPTTAREILGQEEEADPGFTAAYDQFEAELRSIRAARATDYESIEEFSEALETMVAEGPL